jgi:single-stranded DNA-binding protein
MYWQSPNLVVLGGNLTFDPTIREVKSAEGSSKVIDFSIANNLKSSGSPAGKAHFLNVRLGARPQNLFMNILRKATQLRLRVRCSGIHGKTVKLMKSASL